jgi:3-isopropylmalate/(R)-2-methylmalate dehydratase large subunit
MGKTAFQKIVESHCLKVLPDGRMVLRLDWVWCHEITTPNAILDATSRKCDVVFNPNQVKAMIDHVNPAKDTASAIQGKMMREWAKKHGIEFLDVGRNGVCHAVIPEMAWIRPGQIGIMGDSHTCTHGAFCAFTAGVGTTELETGIITGLWICPPQKVIRVNFTGELPRNVFSKDIILYLIGKIGVKGATNAVIEFGGEVVQRMSMEARMTMTNMAVEAGATSGMINVDDATSEFLFPALGQECARKGQYYSPRELAEHLAIMHNSDTDAEYDQVFNIDVSHMQPMVTTDYSPGSVCRVNELAGKPLDQIYIGSCTNGRIEDLRIAAFLMKGQRIADNVRCIVVPATQRVYQQAMEEGLLKTFAEAGCFVSGPTCGACLGMSCGVLAPGEVCVSTTNRNFPGRMGQGGMVHLASPATAAVSALAGKISFPSEKDCVIAIEGSGPRITPRAVARLTNWREVPVQKPDYSALQQGIAGVSMPRRFSGKVFYLPKSNVDTDQIIPARYLTETDKAIMGQHCLEDAGLLASQMEDLRKCQILVAGENFGCGSSREHAPWALEAVGIRCVIAPSFARIFENNMFANGLLCITLPKGISVLMTEKPERILVDWQEGFVSWTQDDGCSEFKFTFGLSDYQMDLMWDSGSVGVMLKLAAELQQQGVL